MPVSQRGGALGMTKGVLITLLLVGLSRLPQPLRATQATEGPVAFGTTDRMPAV